MLRTIGLPELFALVPIALLYIGFYVLIFFSIWKFYKLFSRVNDNLAAIREAIERSGRGGQTG